MEKQEKFLRKRSVDLKKLPAAPPLPDTRPKVTVHNENDPFYPLYTYKDRESLFLRSLSENIKNYHESETKDQSQSESDKNNSFNCEDECYSYVTPLLNRTNLSVSTALATKDSIDQLDKLHELMKQLLNIQEQNFRMRKSLRAVETLQYLKKMDIQIKSDPEKFLKSSIDENSDSELLEPDLEQKLADLEAVLLASRSASSKRNSSKRQRSKSALSDEISTFKENDRNYPLRRQSAISDFKPKVSKWTKVKAAFKWEKANVLALNESKSTESILTPNNHELARYLRVPSMPCGVSSGESLISTSSGRILSGTSIGSGSALSPAELSSATSSGDENDDEKNPNKKKTRSSSYSQEDDGRRSRSLDGDTTLGQGTSSHLDKNKGKSAWSKVKGIVKTHRTSAKSTSKSLSKSSGVSRDVSPSCDSTDMLDMQGEQSPGVSGPHHNLEMDVTVSQSSAISSIVTSGISSDDNDSRSDGKNNKNLKINRGSRKSKHVPEIESLPEGIPLESKNKKPSPLIIQQRDFSESDGLDGSSPIHPTLRRLGNKSLTSSVPNSPSRINEFFSENDFSSGDFSEPVTPDKRLSVKSQSSTQKDEIQKKYQELQKKLSIEFERKQAEWEKIRPLVIALNNTVPPYMRDDPASPSTPKSPVPGLVREDNLSPHFKKKLNEWRQKKNQPPAKENVSVKPTDTKKKNIPAKSEAQNLKLPDAKDLPEDFQKKLNEWKQMKAENRVPTYSQQISHVSGGKRPSTKTDSPKIVTSHLSAIRKSKTADELAKVEGLSKLRALVSEPVNKEIVVQTAEGLLKFEGISRKFTRKLYEWEKARGIGPESSTFALLHPGYKPVFAEHVELLQDNREKSPGIKRCLSVDSINPALPATPISHQPSSLSLNDVDELKENGNNIEKKSIDSNSEYFDDPCKIINRHDSHEQEEPEAVIVEVEDEGFEPPLTPLMTVVQKQIPVFKFDKTKKDSSADHPHSDSNFELIKEVIEINENTICIVEIMCRNSDFSINQVKHLINVYKFLYQLLTKLVIPKDDSEGWKLTKTCMEYYYTTFRLLEEIEESNCGVNVDRKMQTVAKNVEVVKSILEQLRKHFDKPLPKNIPEINVTSVFGHQATQTVQNSDESQKSIATVIVTPTFLCNAVKIDDVQPCVQSSSSVHLEVAESSLVSTTPFSSESEIPYTTDNVVDESRKVTRNSSNGSKRRTRVRRLGSRQNSKTESDSEEDQVTVTLETPRKVKRKTSRCKKTSDTERPNDYQSHQVEDVVYVFKIKPGEKNEVACSAKSAVSAEENILISPTEACVELIEASNDAISPVQPVHQANVNNVIIKTKRKIFSPVDSSDANEGSMKAVVGQDIESSSASDKNENVDSQNPNSIENMPIVSNLPPIPQSPKVSRKDASKGVLPKDVSPNIRLMIQKYNQNIDKKTTSPHSSGSCSPVAWRSPVLDRRVRRQTERYQEKVEQQREGQKISKSSSESKLTDELRENVFINQTDGLPMLKCANGVDEATQTSELNVDFQKFDDNIEETIDKSSVETVVLKDENHVEIGPKGRRRSFENSEHISNDSFSIEKPLTVPSTPSTPVSAPSFTNIKEWLSADSTHEESPPIVVNMRYDESKPRTPLSERALKIKRAKEAFFNGTVDGDFNWTYRMSQISVESTDSFGQQESSKDSTELTTENAASSLERADADESGYASTCPPNISPAREYMEPSPGSSKNSRFGLSSIATKLRKVKLKKSKDISKLNTVSQLCRQSLALDITNSSRCVESSPNGSQNSPEQVPKSNSGQSLSRFKKTEKLDKIKKSKSLGGLDNNK